LQRAPNEAIVVAKVIYDETTALARQVEAIDLALAIVSRFIAKEIPQNQDAGLRFLQALSVELAAPIIFNSMTSKHPAYVNERETRVLLVNDIAKLTPYIKTRVRGSELVPYIPMKMSLKTPGSITMVRVGPAGLPGAEDGVEKLLGAQGLPVAGLVSRSSIPYRSR